MNNKLLTVVTTITILLLSSASLLGQESPPKDDTQLWTETFVYFPKFNPKVNYGFYNLSRIGREISTLTDERNGGFIGYQFIPEFGLTIFGVHVEQDPIRETHKEQERLLTDASGSFKIADDYHFGYRSRFEKQYRYKQDDAWEFRQRFSFDHDMNIGDTHIKPFLSTEGFYRSTDDEWYRLRTLCGITFPIDSVFTLDIYGGKQINREPKETDISMVGFTFRFKMPDF